MSLELEWSDVMDRSGGVRPLCQPSGTPGEMPDGPVVVNRPNGKRHLEVTYRRGIPHGPYRSFRPDGLLSTEGEFRDGVKQGEWRFHRDDGTVGVIHYVDGREVSSNYW